ncbi:hypothetical protein SODALDRAFT_362007 [Sodiomyces alkalinus F11]|uniref:Uncharacterized protein n=1 Tax=Sodiomyces alkalinus (strain CBS 110278 / VKM F-3762 / F11) TaxID=1314773 RepID=A0A3N2PNY4_SODAK|nr:hypothetical protein SODALDRAFT_362007 [Sodiomyces alkalinus F11]ROT36231.1 hypothetical protein SODALDRAFT_362007 [Sodiomyces alkalinus F11]
MQVRTSSTKLPTWASRANRSHTYTNTDASLAIFPTERSRVNAIEIKGAKTTREGGSLTKPDMVFALTHEGHLSKSEATPSYTRYCAEYVGPTIPEQRNLDPTRVHGHLSHGLMLMDVVHDNSPLLGDNEYLIQVYTTDGNGLVVPRIPGDPVWGLCSSVSDSPAGEAHPANDSQNSKQKPVLGIGFPPSHTTPSMQQNEFSPTASTAASQAIPLIAGQVPCAWNMMCLSSRHGMNECAGESR